MTKKLPWLLLAALILLNLIVVIWLTGLLNAEPKGMTVEGHTQPGQVVLPPELIAGAIADKSTDDTKLTLNGEQLLINQRSQFLNLNIKTNILTTPTVIGDNKLRLNINHIEIAGLKLSQKQQLNLIKEFGKLPEGVELDVKNNCFYYQLDSIEVEGTKLILTDIDSEGWHFDIE